MMRMSTKKILISVLAIATFGTNIYARNISEKQIYDEVIIKEYDVSFKELKQFNVDNVDIADGLYERRNTYKINIREDKDLIKYKNTFLYLKDLQDNRIEFHNSAIEVLRENLRHINLDKKSKARINYMLNLMLITATDISNE